MDFTYKTSQNLAAQEHGKILAEHLKEYTSDAEHVSDKDDGLTAHAINGQTSNPSPKDDT